MLVGAVHERATEPAAATVAVTPVGALAWAAGVPAINAAGEVAGAFVTARTWKKYC